MKVTEVVTKLAEPVVAAAGLALWDVAFVREGGSWFLRVYIDRPDGAVSIDDCEAVSVALDPVLDEADPIGQSYTFEVCSAGAERVLKRPRDFEQFMGSLVLVKLYRARDGAREFSGRLTAYEDGRVTIERAKGKQTESLAFEPSEIALVRLQISFS